MSLDAGESKELALFLTGSSALSENSRDRDEGLPSFSIESSLGSSEKPHGRRSTAGANADIDAWKIATPDYSHWRQQSCNGHPLLPPRKIPILSSFFNSTFSFPSADSWMDCMVTV